MGAGRLRANEASVPQSTNAPGENPRDKTNPIETTKTARFSPKNAVPPKPRTPVLAKRTHLTVPLESRRRASRGPLAPP